MSERVSVTPGERLVELALERPGETALVVGHTDGTDWVLSWAELEEWSNRLMHRLADLGVGADSRVAIALPTCVEHVVGTYAALKLGACAVPISDRMPPLERDEMLALAAPAAILSDADIRGALSRQDVTANGWPSAPPATYPVPDPYKAIGSGGSTGRKKLIVSTGGWHYPVGGHPFVLLGGFGERDVVYSTGPLYHNQAFLFTQLAIFAGASVVLNERFDPARAFRLIAQHGVTVLNTVPTVMGRMLRHDPECSEDVSSLRRLWHMSSSCPDWVKQGWIDRIGADAVMELWSATEGTGVTMISGREWLEHRGSVGRPWNTEVRILDAEGNALPVGEVGELWTRFAGGPPLYHYLGADPLPARDGFATVGDLARVDEEGFVYLVDRRVDLIITGGSNVYPAEVEAVISEDPRVKDVAVVGLADEDLGRIVHAIIEPFDPEFAPSEDDVKALCATALARYKVPRSIEIVASLPRDDAGKIQRLWLREIRERLSDPRRPDRAR